MSDFIPGAQAPRRSSDCDTIENRRKMRVVIKRRAYDTETASVIHRCREYPGNPLTGGPFAGTVLYQGLWGKLFLHHYHEWQRYNHIVPLTKKTAIDWMEKNCPDKIEDVFGRLPEAGQTKANTPKPP